MKLCCINIQQNKWVNDNAIMGAINFLVIKRLMSKTFDFRKQLSERSNYTFFVLLTINNNFQNEFAQRQLLPINVQANPHFHRIIYSNFRIWWKYQIVVTRLIILIFIFKIFFKVRKMILDRKIIVHKR